ncbi:hypothetical protein FRB94_007769 [Tulasnella sp. JGI-2019a]|nr:hypothetical protein FRB93_007153 [Tulasnella sp. JGI-2019a]KAG8997320.1 hypothetical protein FRB94_007769 [Tulasnella sp. JGI-2019a]KAG9028112.1 hypothetical protein FRB95_006836 [Tulasnella sp. JGI-2019a]
MSGFPVINVLPSSSIMPREQPTSGHAGRASTPSSFIDGLSHHPSVHATSFLPSSPPPLVHGLERHPDAPKPFTLDLSEDPSIQNYDYFNSNVTSTFSSRKSRFSSRRPLQRTSSVASSTDLEAQRHSGFSTPSLSPSPSIVSAASSSGLSPIFAEVEDIRAEGSPFDDPIPTEEEEMEYVGGLPSTISGLPPSSLGSSIFSNWAGCTKQRSPGTFSSMSFLSQASPPRSVISELFTDYLRRSARV